MSDSNESQSKPKSIAFSFTKKAKQNTVLLNNKLISDSKTGERAEDTDFVTSIDGNQIQSTVQRESRKDLVIPLIVNNRYNVKPKKDSQNKPTVSESVDTIETNETINGDTLEDKARKELLKEANELIDGKKKTEVSSTRVIAVMDSLIQNRVPEGFESNDNFDVSLRPIEPTNEDYQSVPVEEFGLAMLRGMGWKPGMGVGANSKEYTPIEPMIRPKGLGLGAQISLPKHIQNKSKDLKEEDLQPKKGSYVCIEFGEHKGSYGVIEDFDDEMSRVTIKLTLKRESIRIPIALIRVVSKNEFQTEGKVINRKQYEEYKEKEEKVEKHRESGRKEYKSESKRSESNSETKSKKHSSHKTWLLPNLKVKIIDKKYRNGKYYKEKVIIIDVLTPERCSCKTTDGRILDDIDCHMLETVVPRDSHSVVMVLDGKYKNELAVIVDRNQDRNEANVQLLSDKRKIIELSYDEICEFVQ